MLANILRWFIREAKEVKEILAPPVKVGDQYRLITDNPFTDDPVMTIVAKKDGWVKYRYVDGSIDWSMRERDLKFNHWAKVSY